MCPGRKGYWKGDGGVEGWWGGSGVEENHRLPWNYRLYCLLIAIDRDPSFHGLAVGLLSMRMTRARRVVWHGCDSDDYNGRHVPIHLLRCCILYKKDSKQHDVVGGWKASYSSRRCEISLQWAGHGGIKVILWNHKILFVIVVIIEITTTGWFIPGLSLSTFYAFITHHNTPNTTTHQRAI